MGKGLTWICHVCGDERPDAKISVFSRVRLLGKVPLKENVRYCNDRPGCVEGAATHSFTRATVEDVIDDDRLKAAAEEIDRRADEWEFRYRGRRGMVIPKTLWRRMQKWRRGPASGT